MKKYLYAVAVVATSVLALSAQSLTGTAAAAGPRFEVASVKLSAQQPSAAGGIGGRASGGGGANRCPQSFKMDRSRVDIECATLIGLVAYAFRFYPGRITGPDWMRGPGSPRFDIAAKLPEGASENQVPEMVQALLAERFQLAVHRGATEQPINALVVARGGLKVKEADVAVPVLAAAADPDAPPGALDLIGGLQTNTREIQNAPAGGAITIMSNSRMGTVRETDGPNNTQRWEASSITFEGLADLVDREIPLPSPVIDMTGLKGRYQMILEVSLSDVIGPLGPAFASPAADPTARENAQMDRDEAVLKAFNAGLRKLGLQLEHRKGPVETLFVDHLEKTPTGN